MIYLDNSATSYPKPSQTVKSLNRFVRHVGGNPGRSGHDASVEAARIVFDARDKLASLIGTDDSERLVFTLNGTDSLNLAILGLLRESDHVITTSMEHNSVMRPLTFLTQSRHVEVSVAECSPEGVLDPASIKALLKKNTRAVIVNHGSNVCGTIQDLEAVRAIVDGPLLIVDACQTMGAIPIDAERLGIDALCFSCHKSLYGLQGLGAAYFRKGVEPVPLRFGGTGSRSESLEQPSFLPDKYESGTPATPAIAGLLGGLTFIEEKGMDAIMRKEAALTKALVAGLKEIDGVVVYGRHGSGHTLPVVSFNLEEILPSEVGYELNKRGIYVRIGLHCAPAAHRTLGTLPHGTVRVSPGYFTTRKNIDAFLEAMKEIARR